MISGSFYKKQEVSEMEISRQRPAICFRATSLDQTQGHIEGVRPGQKKKKKAFFSCQIITEPLCELRWALKIEKGENS